jgi:hypothetical protein
MPIILAVMYGIGHQNTCDFVIQSIFTRTFLGFAILAVFVKSSESGTVAKRRARVTLVYVSAAAGSVCIITSFSVLVMFGFMLYMWFNPLWVVSVENHMLCHMP